MSYDPLFDPGYMAREPECIRHPSIHDLWVSQNFCASCLPKAGTPWKLPPPLVEDQELDYRFYDDANLDREVFVVAIVHNGVLQWLHLESKECPRRMVGTQWPKKKT